MSRIPIRLSLKKPKNWSVALTTSSSSACIAIPDIRLQDESGRILIDTSGGTTGEIENDFFFDSFIGCNPKKD